VLRSVFTKTLRDRRRALVWWTVGIFAYVLFMDAFWPFVAEQRQQLEQLIESLPEGMMAVFGIDTGEELFSSAGYLNSRSFGWVVPVVFAIYAIGMGARALAGEEEDKTIDLLLANPISRSRVLLEKFAAMLVIMAVLGAALWAALLVGDLLFGLGIAADRYFAATLSATLLGLLFGSVALAAGGLGARAGLIVGLVSTLAVAAFLLNSLGGVVDWLDTARKVSPFYYYDSTRPLLNELDTGHAAVLAGVTLVAVGAAVLGFRRRDLAT
jgi:ABC-2 type transport system permease protein